ncbi:hypothetical protein CLHUN_37870 [Ruminiclostridium hungatei]|uniref:Uncharacterized protein n=1 Tax=Ruminiclostridium hungatei TaxID=48256 RepID=A0A1V4SER6_RUMHU|nr:hypothetical protein [Ruminiclostridium hungatei]OPX42368.1 hypothetical protein CLHUN_37870 [Ruminiclostridium hungatei]
MSQTRNANEFLEKLRGITGRYIRLYRKKIEDIRVQYAQVNARLIDDSLEAHARQYFINELLQALNWRLNYSPTDGMPNMMLEAPIRSDTNGEIKFLDYLGFENGCEKPLMIIEAKRPNVALPSPANETYVNRSPVELITCGLNGDMNALTGEWNKRITTLRDYVCSLNSRSNHIPKRVIMTNGDWLIVFIDPTNAFINERQCNSNNILFWTSREDIENRYIGLFNAVEYNAVLDKNNIISLEELAFQIHPTSIDKILHGIRLMYYEEPQMYLDVMPQIKIAPVLFIGAKFGSWFMIDQQNDQNVFALPHKYENLKGHLNDMETAAASMLNDLIRILRLSIDTTSIVSHYGSQENIDSLKVVKEIHSDYRKTDYIIVTGQETHYLKAQPSISECPYHEWSACQQQGSAIDRLIIKRSIGEPKAFFIDRELHHCAHRGVYMAKSSKISDQNRELCGPRSGASGCAFCEIYSIENLLCCRACFLEEICTRAEAFVLPCRQNGE